MRLGRSWQDLTKSCLFLLVVLVATPVAAQSVFSQASLDARLEQRQQQANQIRPENFDVSQRPVTPANADYWQNLLWTTAVIEPQESYVDRAIASILSLAVRDATAEREIVKAALQVGTQLYLSHPALYASTGQQFQQIVTTSPNPEWVAMSLSALSRGGMAVEQRQALVEHIQQRFPNWVNQVHLYTTLRDLGEMNQPSPLPPIQDLLHWQVAPDQPHLFVFCGGDRGNLCQSVLKDAKGQFVRESTGQLWSTPLLLRSLHHLSWNFTRGQTPQGIFRIEGTRPQDSPNHFRAYGQFPLVKLFIPFERGVREFLPGQPGTLSGGLAAYQALLPPSWRNYYPIQQSYWAGKAGRSYFRIHGTGEDPGFFTNNSRYPTSAGWNPTIGCLSALELYDPAGRLQSAHMPEILQTLAAVGGSNFSGYLIVVDLPHLLESTQVWSAIEQAI
jgi:hypothetical protein